MLIYNNRVEYLLIISLSAETAKFQDKRRYVYIPILLIKSRFPYLSHHADKTESQVQR